jgi:zinc-binding alcohol dehydrogenase/oxidoreductase
MDKMYPLDQFAAAFKRLEEAKQLGKIGFYVE